MNLKTEDIFIQKCLDRIEGQLGWGSSDTWTNQDFESLSKKIQSTTGIYLSITTLKRIWGRVKYESKPTINTLNTLARFLDFESWRVFVQETALLNGNGHSVKEEGINEEHKEDRPLNSKLVSQKKLPVVSLGISAVVLSAIVLFYFLSSWNYGDAELKPSSFSFSSKKIVYSGVPNSVIFDYDASAAASSDSIFIQQSWDKRLRQLVSKSEHHHTSIYYYPGFFEAKLVVNGKVVHEHDLLIQTEGWLPLVEQTPVPVYFNESDAKHHGILSLSPEQLNAKNIQLQPEAPWVAYYNVRTFDSLTTDHFILETEVRNEFNEGSAICQQARIMILTEGSAIIIPLSSRRCVSDLNLFFIDHQVDGKKEDLSAFSAVSFPTGQKCDVR